MQPQTQYPVQPAPKPHRAGKCIAVLLIVALFVAGGYWVYANQDRVIDDIVGLGYDPTPEVAQLVEQLELTDDGMRIMKASSPVVQTAGDFNENCPSVDTSTSVLGCYWNHNLYVYAVDNAELDGVKENTMAHELLHAVWDRYKHPEIAAELEKVYAQNQEELGSHMEHYSEESRVDELHSIIGTQLPDDKLTDRLRWHYAKYFKNRTKIVQYYLDYENKFKETERRLTELRDQIDADSVEINRLTANYEASVKRLNDDINTFNKRARSGYYSSKEQQFKADRERLVARQDQLESDYDYIDQKINEANALIEEYNQNVDHSTELYQSINSQITAPSEALGE